MSNILAKTNQAVIKDLVAEVLNGECIMDRLVNSSYDFKDEAQAMYFSNARRRIHTDVGEKVMNTSQQVEDLHILKMIEGYRQNG